jgi:hypothetical protein
MSHRTVATSSPRRGGLLDALLGLAGLGSEPGETKRSGDPPAPESTSAPTPPYVAPLDPVQRPALREHMDPSTDGGIALSGLHAHPAEPGVFVQVGVRDQTSLTVRFGRAAGPGRRAAVVQAQDLAFVLLSTGPDLVDVRESLGGYWTTRGYHPCGRWFDGRVLLGAPFAARIGFLVDDVGRRGPRLDVLVQWLDGPR